MATKKKAKNKKPFKAKYPVKAIPVKKTDRISTVNNNTAYAILKEKEVPWHRVKSREFIYPFMHMEVGDSFQFKAENTGSAVYSAGTSFCREPDNFHKKFLVRKLKEETIGRVNMVTYGCWRMENLTEEEQKEKLKHIKADLKHKAKQRSDKR